MNFYTTVLFDTLVENRPLLLLPLRRRWRVFGVCYFAYDGVILWKIETFLEEFRTWTVLMRRIFDFVKSINHYLI